LQVFLNGITHNLNNSLQAVLGQAALIEHYPERIELVREAARIIRETVTRSSDLTREISELRNEAPRESRLIDLNAVVVSEMNHASSVVFNGSQFTVSFGNPPLLRVPREGLSKLFSKLFQVLASHAPHHISVITGERRDENSTEATVTIVCEELGIAGSILRQQIESEALPLHVSVEVAEEPSRIILTLSFCAEQLPRSEQTNITGAGPEILIVDDDRMVLETARAVLEESGYGCITADNYRQALRAVKSNPRSLRLVLLDAVMPRMCGVTILKRLKRARSSLVIVGFSGALPAQTQSLLDAGAIRIIRKPVDPETLRREVAEIIGAPASHRKARVQVQAA
jgi:CheY-like chemotaxis protein